jgi:hypothetical protein
MFMPFPSPPLRLTLPSDITLSAFREMTEGLTPDVLVSLNEGETWAALGVVKARIEVVTNQRLAA